MRPITRRAGLAGAAGLLAAPGLRAQGAWNPTRPVTLVVGFPPGGQTDTAARAIQPGMAAALGVPVLIENRGGAAGNNGTEAVMGARPDGTTLLAGNVTPMAVNPHTMDGITVDPREMVAVGLAQCWSLVLCAHPSLKVADLAGLRAWMAHAARGAVACGSAGEGSLSHLAMELFRERLGNPGILHRPARGSRPAMAELLAGRVALLFDGAPSVAPLAREDRLQCVLVTGHQRSPALPQVATATQQGLTDFAFQAWVGLFAPRGTPPEVVARLNAALNQALADPATRERMAARGDEPGGGPPERMARLMDEDYARWGRLVRANNIRAES